MESPLPSAITDELKQRSRETILDYERLILDLHSGRFFWNVGSLPDRFISYFINLSGHYWHVVLATP